MALLFNNISKMFHNNEIFLNILFLSWVKKTNTKQEKKFKGSCIPAIFLV